MPRHQPIIELLDVEAKLPVLTRVQSEDLVRGLGKRFISEDLLEQRRSPAGAGRVVSV